MGRLNSRILTGLACLIATATAVVAPPADAFSPKATITAAQSGLTVAGLSQGGLKTCAILTNGRLKCWGNNIAGELGIGDDAARGDNSGEMGDFLVTVDLGRGRTVKAVASGFVHSCAILDNGRVKCWGAAGGGLLGSGDDIDRGDNPNEMGNNLRYVALGKGRRARAISTGNFHTCALLDNRTLKCWGSNNFGQLGYGDSAERGFGPSQMGDFLNPVNLGSGRTVRAVASSSFHNCALLDNRTVKCWGGNGSGQLGIGDNSGDKAAIGNQVGEMGNALVAVNLGTGRTAKAIAVGADHSCVILDNESVKCWGDNASGQLGLDDFANRGDNAGEMGDSLPPVNLGTGRRAKSITSSGNQTCVILDDKSVKCWGANDRGQLGNGDNAGSKASLGDESGEMAALAPVALGGGRTAKAITTGVFHTCALLDNKTVKCWGGNGNGQLGLGDTNDRGDNEPLSEVPAVNLGVRVRSIHVSYETGCAILENRSVQCWGYNNYGQLGLGDTNSRGDESGEMGDALGAVELGTGRTAKALPVVANYSDFVCAVLDNNALKCWGRNLFGQLGYGDTSNRGDEPNEMADNLPVVDVGTGRTAKAVATGRWHTCALLDNGSVKCWGRSDYGQLGYGDTNSRGDGPNEMGDNLPAVNLGGRRAVAITAGRYSTCALLNNGTVKCWGSNGDGQLGYGDVRNRGDNEGEMGTALPTIDLGTRRRAKAISAGTYHTCALLDNGAVKCWGENTSGKLGYGDELSRGDNEDEMGNDLEAVDLGTDRKAKSIFAAYDQTCAILDNGVLKCWGFNGEGQLGYGDIQDRGDQSDEMGDNLPAVAVGGSRRVLTVALGAFACALLDDYSVRCWGYNGSGELGQGDATDRGDGPNEMGSYLKPVPFTG